METWTRADGCYYCYGPEQGLFGLVVLIVYGDVRTRRLRVILVDDVAQGEIVMECLGRRRRARGVSSGTVICHAVYEKNGFDYSVCGCVLYCRGYQWEGWQNY